LVIKIGRRTGIGRGIRIGVGVEVLL